MSAKLEDQTSHSKLWISRWVLTIYSWSSNCERRCNCCTPKTSVLSSKVRCMRLCLRQCASGTFRCTVCGNSRYFCDKLSEIFSFTIDKLCRFSSEHELPRPRNCVKCWTVSLSSISSFASMNRYSMRPDERIPCSVKVSLGSWR